MSILQEIRNQHPIVRQVMYWLSIIGTLGIIGFFWLTSAQRNLFFALNTDQSARDQFVAEQNAQVPQPLALISKGLGSLTASIGSLLGFDQSKGLDKTDATGHTQDAAQPDSGQVHLLPLSQ